MSDGSAKAGDFLTEGADDDYIMGVERGFEFGEFFEQYKGLIIGVFVLIILVLIYMYVIKPKEGMCGLIDEKHLANCLYYQQPYGKLSDKNNRSNSIMY